VVKAGGAHRRLYRSMSREEKIMRLQTPRGIFFVDADRDKKMAAALRGDVYPNERLLTLARTFVRPGDSVVDIGAHIGTFAIPMAAGGGKVTAFEPAVKTFALLSRNAIANGVSLRLINKALGSKAGSGTLVVRNASNAGADTLLPGGDIPVATLDSEIAHADFIKMDVEGMELEVLLGGSKLIERARPVVLFEVNLSQLRAHGASVRTLERFFTARGYRIYIPLEQRGGLLARVRSATLLTALIAPRAWLFFSESAPFDLVAIPREHALSRPIASFATSLFCALKHNLSVKMRRLRARVY